MSDTDKIDTGDLDVRSQLKLIAAKLDRLDEKLEEKLEEVRSSERGLWANVREMQADLQARATQKDLADLRAEVQELKTEREVRRGQARVLTWAAGLVAPAAVAVISWAVQWVTKAAGG